MPTKRAMHLRCETCKQPLDHTHLRQCALCGGAIGRHHKYVYTLDGRIRHRYCASPTWYYPAKEYIRRHGLAMAKQMGRA
jgi:hypothetical protein